MNNPSTNNNPGKVSPTLLILLILPLLGIAAAIITALVNGGGNGGALSDVQQSAPRLLDWEAPDFQATDMAGKSVRLSDYHGRIVFLNFWETTCEPCVRELPAFQTFLQQQQGRNTPIVLSVNSDESPDTITAFLQQINVTGLHVLLDTDSTAWKAYSIVNLPTTYIIDQLGTVRYLKLGEMKLDDMTGYVKLLNNG